MLMRALAAVLFLLALAAAGCAEAQTRARTQTAIFAGGCFWCTEADFEKIDGVISAESGYTGGTTPNPTYEQVTAGGTGHLEAVRVTFDPSKVSYRTLVDRFWRTIDPTDDAGQFCDKGPSYRPAVFATPAQRAEAEASRAAAVAAFRGGEFRTPVRPAGRFWPAERYHQDFYRKNALRYRLYRQGCGRDARLRAVWAGR